MDSQTKYNFFKYIAFKLHPKLITGLLICFIISTIILLQDELREYSAEEESDTVRQLIKHPHRPTNTVAIKKIIDSVKDKSFFSFAVLGDSQDNLSMFKKILGRIKPDFILCVGDVTAAGRASEYESIMEIVGQYEIPIVFIPGNHDIKNYGTELFLHFMGPLNFFFDMGQYRFVFLDNAQESVDSGFAELPKDGEKKYAVLHGLDNGQIERLEKLLLEKSRNFIVMHLPPPLSGLNFRSFDRESSAFIALVKKYQNRIAKVFCGHIHGYAETLQDGVQYIITAGAGGDLITSKPGLTGRFNYVLVRVSGDSISHEVKYCD